MDATWPSAFCMTPGARLRAAAHGPYQRAACNAASMPSPAADADRARRGNIGMEDARGGTATGH